MERILLAVFGPSWRTSLLGYIGSALIQAGLALDAGLPGNPVVWHVVSIFVLALGRTMKDSAVTGGTKPATTEAKTRVGTLLVLLASLGLAAPALAQEAPEPRFGGCLETYPGVCFSPTVSFNLVAMSLATGDLTTTFDPGPGYGVTFWSDKWHKAGISVSASFPTYEGKRRIEPALIFSFAEFARVGMSCPTYVSGGFRENARLLLSLGVNLWTW